MNNYKILLLMVLHYNLLWILTSVFKQKLLIPNYRLCHDILHKKFYIVISIVCIRVRVRVRVRACACTCVCVDARMCVYVCVCMYVCLANCILSLNH